MQIKYEDVFKSYNGRSGCMCGCMGSYKLKSADDIAVANENTGYNAYGEDDVSPRSVKIAVSKINKALAAGNPDADIDYDADGVAQCAFVDDGSRNTVVYFTESIMLELDSQRARRAAKAAA